MRKNVEVLAYISKVGFVFSCQIQKEFKLSANDVNARLHRFLKYKWIRRVKEVYLKGGLFGEVAKPYCVVRRGKVYFRVEKEHSSKPLWLYLLTEKGKEYLRYKGFNV